MATYPSDYYNNILNRTLCDGPGLQSPWPAYNEYAYINVKLTLPDELNNDIIKSCLGKLTSCLNNELDHFYHNKGAGRTFKKKENIAELMGVFADYLGDDASRLSLRERIRYLSNNFDEQNYPNGEKHSRYLFLCGFLATWFGKDCRQRPAALFAKKDGVLYDQVQRLAGYGGEINAYFSALHSGLRLGGYPDFIPVSSFYAAGEANGHPKHIAYFLPEDEGIKDARNKRSYYLANVHEAALSGISQVLYNALFKRPLSIQHLVACHIPMAAVLAHELGHNVTRPETDYRIFNRYDRWMSVTCQEICADVFGTLIVCEIWLGHLGCPATPAIDYYLAECLRYAHRGVGYFPDSDGVLLQLAWLVDCGALTFDKNNHEVIFNYQPDRVVAALRALARIFTDSFLNQDLALTTGFYKKYSPLYSKTLLPLLETLRNIRPASIKFYY